MLERLYINKSMIFSTVGLDLLALVQQNVMRGEEARNMLCGSPNFKQARYIYNGESKIVGRKPSDC